MSDAVTLLTGEANVEAEAAAKEAAVKEAETKVTADKIAEEEAAVKAAEEEGAKKTVKDGQADETKEKAPEGYEAFTLPEGMEVDSDMMTHFQKVAQKFKLSQEEAQELVDLQTSQLTQKAEAQQKAWDETTEGWIKASKDDEEIGGVGFLSKLATAKKAIEKFGTTELIEAFDVTGIGNHPELLRVFYRIGKLIEEDSIQFGKATAPVKDFARTLYPTMDK